jgi:AcrR family transcriptional regulator
VKTSTRRDRLKEQRREQLLLAAATLFAERGFRAVSVEDLGGAVGISGPAVYRHFPSKEAVLANLLVGVSQRLLEGGSARATAAASAREALISLITFHTDFALTDPDLIRIQDHDLTSLPPSDSAAVRHLQRSYVEVWVDVLTQLDPAVPRREALTRVHAVFGLLNSTPHFRGDRDDEAARRTLERMALNALCGELPARG